MVLYFLGLTSSCQLWAADTVAVAFCWLVRNLQKFGRSFLGVRTITPRPQVKIPTFGERERQCNLSAVTFGWRQLCYVGYARLLCVWHSRGCSLAGRYFVPFGNSFQTSLSMNCLQRRCLVHDFRAAITWDWFSSSKNKICPLFLCMEPLKKFSWFDLTGRWQWDHDDIKLRIFQENNWNRTNNFHTTSVKLMSGSWDTWISLSF